MAAIPSYIAGRAFNLMGFGRIKDADVELKKHLIYWAGTSLMAAAAGFGSTFMTFINVERASHGARSVTALYFLGVFDRLASAAAAAAAAAFITRATVQYTGGAYSSSSSPQKPALRTDPLSPAVHLASTKIISALFYPGQQPQPQPQWQKGNWIGSGSSGQVYLGFHSVTGQRCAIKEIDVTSHSSMKQRVQLKRSHNVLSIYMEYVSGGSLHMLLAKYGALAESMIRNYTAQILFGLDYLHKREIIHRDIKGANILVGRNGDIKLADFGLAKRISSVAAAHTGEKGSIYWVAPEVMKPDQGRYIYDLRADIWSLGFTVIEMATGKHPWHPLEPAQAMCEMLIKGKIPKVPDNLSEEGKDFVQQCLQLDPTSRPSAAELLCHPFIRNRSAA